MEQGAGGMIHFSSLLLDVVSHSKASCGSEEIREAELLPVASSRGSTGVGTQSQKCLWLDLLSRQGQAWQASAKRQAALAVVTDTGWSGPSRL